MEGEMTLTEFLADRGMTQSALAKLLGVSATHLSLTKSGQKEASFAMRCRFAEHFPGYDVEGFTLTEEEQMLWQAERRQSQGAGPVSVSFAMPESELVETVTKKEVAVDQDLPWIWLVQGKDTVAAFETQEAALLAIARWAVESGLWDLQEIPVRS
jgi:transcriptional regulator with XRE-family HTH domain